MCFVGVVLLAGGLLFTAACETSRKDADTGDSIQIMSVTNKHVKAGNKLQVSLEYTLVSSDYGDVDIAFNTGADSSEYFYVSNITKTVAAGTGKHEFNVPVSITNWPASSTVYSVYVSLSVPLHSIPWRPLADDTEDFTFDE